MDGSLSESGFSGENDGIIFGFYIFRHAHSYAQLGERQFNLALSPVTSRGGRYAVCGFTLNFKSRPA